MEGGGGGGGGVEDGGVVYVMQPQSYQMENILRAKPMGALGSQQGTRGVHKGNVKNNWSTEK